MVRLRAALHHVIAHTNVGAASPDTPVGVPSADALAEDWVRLVRHAAKDQSGLAGRALGKSKFRSTNV